MKKVVERLGSKEKVTTFAPATTATLLERLKDGLVNRKAELL
ncbi:hypothetical protein [Flavobacterium akiainvivens]|nr:hypothetical protein [Flavobacterium akiainvivens]